jgi:hydroxyacid-oxoacid transhydrogenase
VFRLTSSANPRRHLEAAAALGANVDRAQEQDAGKILADRIGWFMHRLHTPNGLSAIGYTLSDIPALVDGTLPQHRVTKLSPRAASADDLSTIFEDAMNAW